MLNNMMVNEVRAKDLEKKYVVNQIGYKKRKQTTNILSKLKSIQLFKRFEKKIA
ncbi:hypothetical protein ACLIA0_07780 [Bacillaceae bacterium W0354]